MGAGSGRFSGASVACLRASGWHEGRRIEDSVMSEYERECGPLHEAAREFLREFGGIRLEFPNLRVPDHLKSDPSLASALLVFDPVEAVAMVVSDAGH